MNKQEHIDMIPIVLEKLAINSNYKGYLYLKETIEMLYDEYRPINEVYRILALKYSTSLDTIDKAVRRCIKACIKNSSSEDRIDIFGYDIEKVIRRNYYTTGELITHIMNYIHKCVNWK